MAGFLDGWNRGLIVLIGALLVAGFPFVEAYALNGALPWAAAFDGKAPFAIVDGAIRIIATFLIPYGTVRILFCFFNGSREV